MLTTSQRSLYRLWILYAIYFFWMLIESSYRRRFCISSVHILIYCTLTIIKLEFKMIEGDYQNDWNWEISSLKARSCENDRISWISSNSIIDFSSILFNREWISLELSGTDLESRCCYCCWYCHYWAADKWLSWNSLIFGSRGSILLSFIISFNGGWKHGFWRTLTSNIVNFEDNLLTTLKIISISTRSRILVSSGSFTGQTERKWVDYRWSLSTWMLNITSFSRVRVLGS